MTAAAVMNDWIPAAWPAPAWVHAGTTCRGTGDDGGSEPAGSLALNTGADPAQVASNRRVLERRLGLPGPPRWLHQVHGNRLVCADTAPAEATADASYSRRPGVVCAVLTADCVPVLLSDRAGTRIAAVHAGWRGLCSGVIGSAVQALAPASELLAWLGPHVRSAHYQVGAEVRAACCTALTEAAQAAFTPGARGHWYADLEQLSTLALERAGVHAIYSCGLCTYADPARFYSYRRNQTGGRMASLVWRDPAAPESFPGPVPTR